MQTVTTACFPSSSSRKKDRFTIISPSCSIGSSAPQDYRHPLAQHERPPGSAGGLVTLLAVRGKRSEGVHGSLHYQRPAAGWPSTGSTPRRQLRPRPAL